MGIEIIDFNGEIYPKFQAEGFASQYAFPFAKQVCKGVGLDIGCGKIEWAFPGAIPIDKSFDTEFGYHADFIPKGFYDYIFSSHCLEHVDYWVATLDYWIDHITDGGVLFLYLPDFSQEYWRPWNNRKHKHIFTPTIIAEYMRSKRELCKQFISAVDLNSSFMAMAEVNRKQKPF